ncbi:phage portal protein [Rhodococcus rhodochrous]|uniref:phage portal protein n=1 Tax=Rhodococcus rhodochrous TaxID=1829 RepID=UPI00177F3C5D|nr:phage portal protein [Rhodococcus rhodochrous]
MIDPVLDETLPDELSDAEARTIGELREKVRYYAAKNEKKLALYEGEFVADQIGIAVPPMLKDWPVRIGWGGTVVNTNAARSRFLDFQAPAGDLQGLDKVVATTRLRTKSDRVMENALVVGTSFVVVGKNKAGRMVIESKSPSVMAVRENYWTGQLDAALLQVRNDKGWTLAETLYLPNETITLERRDRRLTVTHRDRHQRGEVPVEQFKHRPNDSHPNGRSLITAPIEYTISAAARTMLGLEVHREFFSGPMRAAIGADPEQFGVTEDMTEDEKYRLGWSLVMGRMNIVPPAEDSTANPTMHEFKPSPPTSYIDIMKYLSLMVASDSGLPASYFGIMTDNPASSDSIKALESQIEQRAIERMREMDWHWINVARKILLWRDGTVDENKLADIHVEWASPSTPTPSAAADAGMKLVAANILPADSKVTYDRIGLSDIEQKQLIEDKRRASLTQILSGLDQAAATASTDLQVHNLASRRVDDDDA